MVCVFIIIIITAVVPQTALKGPLLTHTLGDFKRVNSLSPPEPRSAMLSVAGGTTSATQETPLSEVVAMANRCHGATSGFLVMAGGSGRSHVRYPDEVIGGIPASSLFFVCGRRDLVG